MSHEHAAVGTGSAADHPEATGSRLPRAGWLTALVFYLAGRALTTLFTLLTARVEPANLWTGAQPSYGEFTSMWDADRYRRIAVSGYPLPLPLGPDGQPGQSEWAFFPLYPMLVKLAMGTGLPFTVAGHGVALLLGCLAAVLIYRLFAVRAGHHPALAGVAMLTLFPSAAVLQYAYSESTCLCVLAATLLLVERRNYLAAVPFAVATGLSRPIGPALVLTLLIVGVARWGWSRRRADATPPGRARDYLVLLAAGTGGAVAFPVAVALVAGRPDGYTAVQSAWRVQHHMEYFTPWLWMSRYVFGDAGPYLLGALALATVLMLASRPVRRLGIVLWAWCASYALFLAAVLDPFSSLVRHMLLFFPLGLALVTATRPGRGRTALLVAATVLSAGLQGWWVAELWHFTPPSDYPP